MASILPMRWLRPAAAVRRIVDSVLRRRTILTPSGEHARLRARTYTGRLVSDPRDGLTMVQGRVASLLDAQALDEAHADVLDAMIDALLVPMRNQVDDEHDDNQRFHRISEAEAAAEVERRRLLLDLARADLAEIDADLARLLERPARGAADADTTPGAQ